MSFKLGLVWASLAAMAFGASVQAQLADLQPGCTLTTVMTFGSSRAANDVAADGPGGASRAAPWRDWSCDSNFGDIDDDGSVDLFHSSYGPSVGGERPSRIFLGDTRGVFNELFPWADRGVDAPTPTIEIALADFDGDFDLHAPLADDSVHDIRQVALIDQGAILVGAVNYEGEYGDVDGDGDFDVWLKSYSGASERLVRNEGAQRSAHVADLSAAPVPEPQLDADPRNAMFRDILGAPDAHAPAFSMVTAQGDKPNGTPTVVHGQIRDNGPGESLTNYFDWRLVYSVDDGPPTSVPMIGQFGAQARGVIPAQTDARVAYHVECTDLAGNTGASGTVRFLQGAGWRTKRDDGLSSPSPSSSPRLGPGPESGSLVAGSPQTELPPSAARIESAPRADAP